MSGSYLEVHDSPKRTKKLVQITMSVLPLDQQEVSEKHFFVMYRHIKRTKKTSKFIRMVALDQLLIKVNDWCKKSKR